MTDPSKIDPSQYEEDYKRYISNLWDWIPDGIVEVNLEHLNELGLLEEAVWTDFSEKETFSHYFHVLETSDKVTLYNAQFVVWIVPQSNDNQSLTFTLISILQSGKPHLEIVFSTRGIYNTPKCILKVLRHYLEEVSDTQDAISSMNTP